jgi:hypothetical protein
MGYGVSRCPFLAKKSTGQKCAQIGLMYVKRTNAHLETRIFALCLKTPKMFLDVTNALFNLFWELLFFLFV